MTPDPSDRWVGQLERRSGSGIGPWVIVAILLLAAFVARVGQSATKPEKKD